MRRLLAVPAAVAALLCAGVLPGAARAGTVPSAPAVEPVLLGADGSVAPRDSRPRAEISMAVDPHDPRRVALVAIQFGQTLVQARTQSPYVAYDEVWTSRDGGRTFRDAGPLPPLGRSGGSNDPTLAWDPKGPLYASYTAFTHPSGADAPQDGLYVARSDDGGATWRRSSLIEGFHCEGPDRSTVAVDPRRGWVYVAWTHYGQSSCSSSAPDPTRTQLRWSRSTDGGRTFSRPVIATRGGESAQVAPAVLPDGTLVTLHSVAGSAAALNGDCQYPTSVVATRWAADGRRLSRSVAMVTCDNGAGLSTNGATFVPIRFPSVSVDPLSGQLLASMPSVGALSGVMTAVSGDGGRSWTSQLVTGLPGSEASMATVSVGGDHRAALAWLELEPAGVYRPVLAGSADAGRSWSAPVPVASVPSLAEGRPFSPLDRYSIGHYLGAVVGNDRVAHLGWPDIRPDPGRPNEPDVYVRSAALG